MSSTSGYGETPTGSSPEQPEWLRKAPATPPSDSPHGAPAVETAPTAHGFDDYANPTSPGSSPRSLQQGSYPGAPYAGQSSYTQQPQQPQHPQYPYPQPAQHSQPYPAQYPNQHPAQYPGHQPGAYPPPGSPWAPVDPHAKSRLAAGLLGIFLGALGIHRFYLGYTGVGIAMLLLTVLSFGFLGIITSIWGLVEGILYLTDKTGRYSRDATGRRLRD